MDGQNRQAANENRLSGVRGPSPTLGSRRCISLCDRFRSTVLLKSLDGDDFAVLRLNHLHLLIGGYSWSRAQVTPKS